jgi:processive 1,2-diacylglycerol beta-glucosyltransferase
MNTPPPIKKLLVLTSATGAGHDSHAQATMEWCQQLYGEGVEVRIVHLLEDSHFFYKGAVEFYNIIQRNAPWFHHVYFNVIEFLDLLNAGTVSLGRKHTIQLFQEFQPDAILSVHDCLNRGYVELAKSVLGEKVRCATYCTEFSGGYGFSRNWVNLRSDTYFSRTEEVRLAAKKAGVPAERIVKAGHWAAIPFYAAPMSDEEKGNYLSKEFSLEKNLFTLLLSTGGAGAQNHLDLLRVLQPLGTDLQVIVLCGRDPVAKIRLEQAVAEEIKFPVRALSFTRDMPRLLQACSAVVARAGATTAGEALLCGCPMLFNALGGIMPQEMPTQRTFQQWGISSPLLRQPRDLKKVVETWLDQPQILLALKSKILQHRDTTTPEQALRRLLD